MQMFALRCLIYSIKSTFAHVLSQLSKHSIGRMNPKILSQ
jgi:hypothetical protein